MGKKTEKDLKIYDLWESPNGNLFLKVSEDYSIALGTKGYHKPNEYDLKGTQYIKSNGVTPAKKVGKLKFK